MSQRVLGVFAKAPIAGAVKTRLADAIGATRACEVAAAFLRDTVDRCATLAVNRMLVFAPAAQRYYFTQLAGACYELEAQDDGDLGRRLAGFFSRRLAANAARGRSSCRVVVIGTDSPNLPLAWLRDAFAALEQADVVLGPAWDGGYYLIGLRRFSEDVFQGIAWGTAAVFEETVARVERLQWKLALLPAWYDVDTAADLDYLYRHLTAQGLAGDETMTPHTLALLQELAATREGPAIAPAHDCN